MRKNKRKHRAKSIRHRPDAFGAVLFISADGRNEWEEYKCRFLTWKSI